MTSADGFVVEEAGGVRLTDAARKRVLVAWQERKRDELRHLKAARRHRHDQPPSLAPEPSEMRTMFRVNKSYSAIEAGPAKAAELDGELLECCAEAAALEAHARALTKGIPSSGRSLEWDAADAMMEEAYDLRERAIALPARTPAGLQAKAKVVAARINDEDPIVMGMVFSIARDVLGRAGA